MVKVRGFIAGRDLMSRPVLLLLLTVTIPSVGIVWMMSAAVENERIAVRQRLNDAHRLQLDLARTHVQDTLASHLHSLDSIIAEATPSEIFHHCAVGKFLDSVIVLARDGKVRYPEVGLRPETDTAELHDELWQQAQGTEFVATNFREAARLYGVIAERADNLSERGRAEQARARCLVQSGETVQATAVLQRLAQLDGAYDPLGRSLAIDARLSLLDHLQPQSKAASEVRAELRTRLDSYSGLPFPASQRRFAMRRLQKIFPDEPEFTTLAAEDLAAEVVEKLPAAFPSAEWRELPGAPDTWGARTPAGQIVAIARAETLQKFSELALRDVAKDSCVMVHAPKTESGNRESSYEPREVTDVGLEPFLPGWKLSLVEDANYVLNQAGDRTAFYTWLSVATLAITFALTGLAIGQLQRQNHVARLKNDLVATISHELKTPLASIRLLVDTLLEMMEKEPVERSLNTDDMTRVREYLGLIAGENSRLSRLIDNFLTFSRMERGQHVFDRIPCDLGMVARSAAERVGEKYKSAGMPLEADIDGAFPIRGDADALVTAVVNLLENALKYAGAGPQVTMSVKNQGCHAVLAVADDGPGLSPQACRHVFDRFYQVDQRLSRSQGGCGLGLSIVQYIARAHEGDVSVESELGKGCRFLITLPLGELR